MKDRQIGRRRKPMKAGIRVVVINEDGETFKTFPSREEAASYFGVTGSCIVKHIRNGKPLNGYILSNYERKNILKQEFSVPAEDDKQVAMFDKDGDIILAIFKSVTQCANALQRPAKTVYDWLHGARCTDPDCYYKYLEECTEEEIKNRYIPPTL